MSNYIWYGTQLNAKDYLTIGELCSNSTGFIACETTQSIKVSIYVEELVKSGSLQLLVDGIAVVDIPITSNSTIFSANVGINSNTKIQVRADSSLTVTGEYYTAINTIL